MKRFVIFFLIILMGFWVSNGFAYYKWYDKNGQIHFSDVEPPLDAKDKDGNPWWKVEEKTEKSEKKAQNQGVQSKSDDTFIQSGEMHRRTKEGVEEDESEEKGFMNWLKSFISDDEEELRSYPILIEKYGIRPLETPDLDKVGSTFKAKVVNMRKRVWSSCKGTRNGDIIFFTNKGGGYWETHGGVPDCPYYEGFYMTSEDLH